MCNRILKVFCFFFYCIYIMQQQQLQQQQQMHIHYCFCLSYKCRYFHAFCETFLKTFKFKPKLQTIFWKILRFQLKFYFNSCKENLEVPLANYQCIYAWKINVQPTSSYLPSICSSLSLSLSLLSCFCFCGSLILVFWFYYSFSFSIFFFSTLRLPWPFYFMVIRVLLDKEKQKKKTE